MDRFSKARDAKDRRKKGEIVAKSRQSQMNDERLYFKFISKYIEGVHPAIFAEAVGFYKRTVEKNPGISDCTKTIEFVSTVTPNKPIPRHYHRRKLQRPQEITPKMQPLEIPLLTKEQLLAIAANPQLTDEQLSATTSTTVPVSEQVSAPPSQLPPQAQLSEQVSAPALLNEDLLSPEIYKQLLEELQLDPQLNQIFEDLEEDDGMDETVWDDVSQYTVEMY